MSSFAEKNQARSEFSDYVDSIGKFAILVMDREYKHIYAQIGPEMEAKSGLKAGELLGKTIAECFPPEIAKTREILVDNMFANGEQTNHEFGVPGPDGKKNWLEYSYYAKRNEDGEIVAVINTISDISRQRNIVEEVKAMPDITNSIIEHNPYGIMIFNKDGYVIRSNKAFSQVMGLDKVGVEPSKDYCFFEDEVVKQYGILDDLYAMREGKIFRTDIELCLNYRQQRVEHPEWYPYEEKFIEATCFPVFNDKNEFAYFVVMYQDVTEKRLAQNEKEKFEKMLHQAQKMEMMGTLAGGIAHDFNNILTGILWSSKMVQDAVKNDPAAGENVGRVIEGANRARDLVNQILTFSRQSDQKRIPIRIQDTVNEALKFMKASMPKNIEIKADIDDDCQTVLADSSRIFQVVLNLCTNGFQAVGEKDGTVEVSLTESPLEDLDGIGLSLPAGDYVKLTIKDSGRGMDSDTVDRIFDPFFTTKEQGEGTGLGLSVVHGIVEGHDGRIMVKSEPGQGAIFDVYFPVFRQSAYAEDISSVSELPKGSETIMMVDDEEAILDAGSALLTGLGYKVDTYREPIQALQDFKLNPGKYDLLLTDQVMPKMTGFQLHKKITQIAPEFPTIIMTGFSKAMAQLQQSENQKMRLIVKPMDPAGIAGMIREVIGWTAQS